MEDRGKAGRMRLLELSFDARERARYRKDRLLGAVWVAGLAAAVLSPFSRVSFALWVLAFILYARLYSAGNILSPRRALLQIRGERRQIRALILLLAPVAAWALSIAVLSVLYHYARNG